MVYSKKVINGFAFYTTFAKDILRFLLERFLGTFVDFSVVRLYLLRYDCIHIQLQETHFASITFLYCKYIF